MKTRIVRTLWGVLLAFSVSFNGTGYADCKVSNFEFSELKLEDDSSLVNMKCSDCSFSVHFPMSLTRKEEKEHSLSVFAEDIQTGEFYSFHLFDLSEYPKGISIFNLFSLNNLFEKNMKKLMKFLENPKEGYLESDQFYQERHGNYLAVRIASNITKESFEAFVNSLEIVDTQ
jgi:hypothetical protein